MIEQFIDGLLRYHFLQNALITSMVIGMVSGVVGSLMVLRSLSLMGDAISHGVLPGVALSYIFGVNVSIGAMVFGLTASALITFIKERSIVKMDTAIGIIFSAFLALGVILIGMANSSTDLFHILFGNILAVQDSDKWLTIVVSLLVIGVIALCYKPLLLTTFDPELAKAMGLPVSRYHYLLMGLLTVVSVTAMQSVGTMLIVSQLVTPAATAYLFAKSLKGMMLLASALGALSAFLGLFIGYSFNIAVGSSIILVATVIFMMGFLYQTKR